MKSGRRRCAADCTQLPTRRSAIADPEAGCTTAPARLASGKPLPWMKGQAADAHLKRHGPPSEAVVVALTNGRLDFGTWEQIFYGNFDGRRRKRVLVKIIGE
jgi:hypothetical protein